MGSVLFGNDFIICINPVQYFVIPAWNRYHKIFKSSTVNLRKPFLRKLFMGPSYIINKIYQIIALLFPVHHGKIVCPFSEFRRKCIPFFLFQQLMVNLYSAMLLQIVNGIPYFLCQLFSGFFRILGSLAAFTEQRARHLRAPAGYPDQILLHNPLFFITGKII